MFHILYSALAIKLNVNPGCIAHHAFTTAWRRQQGDPVPEIHRSAVHWNPCLGGEPTSFTIFTIILS